MSSQGNPKPFIKHTYPSVRIDMKKHGVNPAAIRRYVSETGVVTTVRTLDERKARLEPSLHRFNNLMYMLNHPVKFEAYLR